jgi:hypothetical protein
MENNNQRTVFVTPGEDTTPMQITLSILEDNGVSNIEDNPDDQKLTTVFNTTKDFFDKKITEEKMLELFQKELPISKEGALSIIKELKEKIIPYGKKISDSTETKEKINLNISASNIPINEPIESVQKNISENNPLVASTIETSSTPPKKLPRIKQENIAEEIKNSIPPTTQPSGPDNYREPIE